MKIFKYPIRDQQNEYGVYEISMPVGATILFAALQSGAITLWAAVDNIPDEEPRYIAIVGTGHEYPTEAKYIGSVQQGQFVWHIFENPKPEQLS